MAKQPRIRCAVCGSALEIVGSRALCQNSGCSGGGVFTQCEFCGDYSFSLRLGYCVNPNCRLYEKKRTACPVCNSKKVVTYNGRPVCMNPSCASNLKRLDRCFFCGKKTFLKAPSAMFCVNPSCSHLLERVSECPHCRQLSFVESAECCENADCSFYKVKMALCDSCGQMSKIADKKHPQYGRCVNPDCEGSPVPADQSDEQAKTSSEGEACSDTVEIPLEILRSASVQEEVTQAGDTSEVGERQQDHSNTQTPVLRIEVVGDALAWLKDELRKRGLSSVIRIKVEFAETDKTTDERGKTR
ncbi:MAG: hypothetical protein DRP82_02780 [Planctomycetota bacterium]|nr:MAG: hypothetical protein DRP82_02780 [Planctomycetota bacterium]